MLDNEALINFKQEILTLNQSTQGGRIRPHKQAMLLAVMDLADGGLLQSNRIYFDEELISRFAKYFAMLSIEGEGCRSERPFFHLRSSQFWKHKIREGQEENYRAIKVADFRPVKDTIEYSYLRDDVFQLLSHTRHRDELRGFIMRLTVSTKAKSQNLGFSFHRGFALMRTGVSQVLREAVLSENGASNNSIREATSLGTVQVEAMPRYAERAGLVDSDRKPTAFGLAVHHNDAGLSKLQTQWLMHYFLAAPHRNAPNYWNVLSASCFNSGEEFDNEFVTKKLSLFAVEHSTKTIKPRTLSDSATAFLGTYLKDDSLGGLKILRKTGEGRYAVNEEFAARGLGVVACALGDFWAARFGDTKKVNLGEVTGAGGLAPLLLMSPGELQRALAELQARGVLSLERATPPFQIARGWEQPAALWEQLYEG